MNKEIKQQIFPPPIRGATFSQYSALFIVSITYYHSLHCGELRGADLDKSATLLHTVKTKPLNISIPIFLFPLDFPNPQLIV